MRPWIKKYQPKKLSEVVGQKKPFESVKLFTKTFPKPKRAALLYGPPGTGKTAIVQALANEFGFELIELNASDFRDKQSVLQILGPATTQVSLFGNKKIILVDEVDCISGQKDRGGIAAVIDVIKKTQFPIFLTANDPFLQKLKTLRQNCMLVELKKINTLSIVWRLKEICKIENISYTDSAIQKIAIASNGDLRAAINDLQMIAQGNRKITEQDVKQWDREQEESVFNALKLIFKSYDVGSALKAVNSLNIDLDSLILWIDQNIPAEYLKLKELFDSYVALSRADIFLSRIIHWQHWRFLIYAQALAVVGVQQAKQSRYNRFVMHRRPELLLKLYIRAAKRKKLAGLGAQISDKLHTSSTQLMKDFWPYFSFIQKRNPDMAVQLSRSLGL